jgi:hypothetical protein
MSSVSDAKIAETAQHLASRFGISLSQDLRADEIDHLVEMAKGRLATDTS